MHRKIFESHYGKIPKDENGRSYEIHHIDGDHKNNNLSNLKLVTIEEHYKIHLDQGDFGACTMIGKRMKMSPEEISSIQKGKKQPGIGGRKKGCINRTGWHHSEETKRKWSEKRKGKVWCPVKINKEEILADFLSKPQFDAVGEIQQNGRKMSYLWAFCKDRASKYNVTPEAINHLLKKATRNNENK